MFPATLVRGPVRAAGVSFIEILLAVTLLGLITAVALPNLSPASLGKLDFATGEIIEALRFARSESIRSGDVFGVTVNEATDRITVFKAKMAPLPVSPDYIVYHPVRKQLWDVRLAANPASSGVDVESTGGPFEYIGLAPQPTVLFNPRGRPFGVDIATGTTYRLDSQTKIKLNYQQSNKNISLDPINGRVTS